MDWGFRFSFELQEDVHQAVEGAFAWATGCKFLSGNPVQIFVLLGSWGFQDFGLQVAALSLRRPRGLLPGESKFQDTGVQELDFMSFGLRHA